MTRETREPHHGDSSGPAGGGGPRPGPRRSTSASMATGDEGSRELSGMDVWEGWERGRRSVVVPARPSAPPPVRRDPAGGGDG